MSGHVDIGKIAQTVLATSYPMEQRDLGADTKVGRNGVRLQIAAWDVCGFGHLSTLHMSALLGLMRMETAILAPTCVDAPILTVDWVSAMGTEVQIIRLFDVQLRSWPDAYQREFRNIAQRLEKLPDVVLEPSWYDEIMYDCSCLKQGRGVTNKLARAAEDYLATYAAMAATLPSCDQEQKTGKVRDFARRMYSEDSVTVRQATKHMGEDAAQRIIVQHLYGMR